MFDDKRVFDTGPSPGPVVFRGFRLGLMICEDWWFPAVSETLAESGAEMLLSINGSPYEIDKQAQRIQLALNRVVETGLPFVFCAQVCGQDELVFDGASFVLNADHSLAAQLPHFETAIVLTEWRRTNAGLVCTPQPLAREPDRIEAIYRCMMLGLGDYVRKNRFPGVILGLSGGIDSALSAAVAVDALGAPMVRSFMLPSPYTSQHSLDDAAQCARLLGIPCDIVSIEPAMAAFNGMLEPVFNGRQADITEENIQSRSRGLILMAISNKLGHMVLTTGNKSEMSVGYATLYGDMCGGYSVLKDVYKTTVFELSRWRNEFLPRGALGPAGIVIPGRIITKPPSAELKPNQTDQDSLPPYDELDGILQEPGGGRAQRRRDGGAGLRSRHRAAGLEDAGSCRIQAPPGAAGGEDNAARVRPRPALSDHQRLYQFDFMSDLFAPPGGWRVRILDLSGGAEDNVVEEIGGFGTLMQANAFARRYVRDSVELCRAAGASPKEVLEAWFAFGEDAEVMEAGDAAWKSGNELSDFIDRPAGAEDRDWRALDPRRDEEEEEGE